MENWLSNIERPNLAQLESCLKYLFSRLNQFSRQFNHQKFRLEGNLVCSHVDVSIDANLEQLHQLSHLLLKKMNLTVKKISRASYFTKTMTDMLALPQFCRSQPSPFQHRRKAKHISKNQPRGPYRSYTIEEKQFVLNMHLLGKTFASISKELEIPQKNVVRWCREGLSGKPFSRRGSNVERNPVCSYLHGESDAIKQNESQVEESENLFNQSESPEQQSNLEDTPCEKQECD